MKLETIDEIVDAIRKAPTATYGELSGEEAKKAILDLVASAYEEKHPSLCAAESRADVGHLKWADGEEQFTTYHSLGWDLTIDDFGRVRATIIMRDSEGEILGGVQMDATDLMKLSRYCFSHATLRLHKDCYNPDDTSDLTYLKAHVIEFLKDVKAHCPEILEELIESEALQSVANKALEAAELQYNARLEGEIRAMEKRWAKHVVRLSSIAAREDAVERDERLNDPLLQETITKAFQISAES
jgi:hypothetical protein